mmetsp:Transcript_16344/g.20355  ORF Transcript_16344/g.20355 Transcript_16344/m.20355 type:complete len:496 (-) Transcript_16344:145-1632(-)
MLASQRCSRQVSTSSLTHTAASSTITSLLSRANTIAILLLVLVIGTATPTTSTTPVCSNSTDLHHRISNAISPKNGKATPYLDALRGTIDNVLSAEECDFLLRAISPSKYVSGSGYNEAQYGAYRSSVGGKANLAGLELSQLSSPKTGFGTEKEYKRYLSIREKARAQTERSLGLCPGTLRIDFTHLSQKKKGGKHAPHADNCFYELGDYIIDAGTGEAITSPRCDQTRKHPFSTRVAASILFLNDNQDFGGGEFYWADHATGEPSVLVTPKAGRMTYFSAGPENLHGALPVEDIPDDGANVCNDGSTNCEKVDEKPSPRRIYLALWYVDNTQPAEVVPSYRSGDGSEAAVDDPNAPTTVLDIPVKSLKAGGLRVALSFLLLALQNEPTKGSWRIVQQDDIPLGMLFKDKSAMFAINLKEESIVVERHVDYGKRPSLVYQLQESVALHKVLDELESLAFGKGDDGQEIKEENRLVSLRHNGVIEAARKKLPARAA